MFYRPHKTVLCDICDDEDCGNGCFTETITEESGFKSFGIKTVVGPYLVLFALALIWFVQKLIFKNK